MHESDTDLSEGRTAAYLRWQQRNADKGEYWYIWLLVAGFSALVTWIIFDVRGLGLWLIATVVVLLLLLVEIPSWIYATIVIGVGAIVGIIYFLIAYQVL